VSGKPDAEEQLPTCESADAKRQDCFYFDRFIFTGQAHLRIATISVRADLGRLQKDMQRQTGCFLPFALTCVLPVEAGIKHLSAYR